MSARPWSKKRWASEFFVETAWCASPRPGIKVAVPPSSGACVCCAPADQQAKRARTTPMTVFIKLDSTETTAEPPLLPARVERIKVRAAIERIHAFLPLQEVHDLVGDGRGQHFVQHFAQIAGEVQIGNERRRK